MSALKVKHEEWPPLGRVGRCKGGEYEGHLILLVPEIRTLIPRREKSYTERAWYAYIVRSMSSPDGEAGEPVDDFEIGTEKVSEVLGEMCVEWLPENEGDRLEKEYFGLRQEWRRREG